MMVMRLLCGITAHRVWVEWDTNDVINDYGCCPPYLDLTVVDEHRTLKPCHKLDVGCVVKPGE